MNLREEIDKCLIDYEQALTKEVIADYYTQTTTKKLLHRETLDRITEAVEKCVKD